MKIKQILNEEIDGEKDITDILDLLKECLDILSNHVVDVNQRHKIAEQKRLKDDLTNMIKKMDSFVNTDEDGYRIR